MAQITVLGKYIEDLNLAYNDFNYTQIPSEFGQLTGLSSLNLMNAGFTGKVPIEILYFTRLVTLDLQEKIFQVPTLQTTDLSIMLGLIKGQ
ncbi:receptor-like protein 12 [Pyrus ussuriensis x Pyrus communis]|uniref:Receptor-like protein 12 n=1 Tax=Pyrus ussuriensis x Pyrus communis TaxID=2448454 RepID=A0A5N5H3V9_9ROSA|nr:receptor-like protein 12 [Pyrus ussuriensis x Pyrus communis]